MQHQRWSELSGRRKVGVVLVTSAQLALTVGAYRDLVKRPADQVDGPKIAWGVAILVNWIGPLTYFARGRVSA